ncbi:MAG: TAXI family TRAP transporter solute-binding subunit [Bacillota bacterium]
MLRFNRLVILLALFCILVLLVTSCGDKTAKNQPASGQAGGAKAVQSDGKAGGPWKVTILGGAVGGVWSAITEGVAECMRRSAPPGSNITAEPGKDGPNSVMVAQKKAELAISYTPTAYTAIKGTDPFKEAYPDIRAVATLNPDSTFHFLVMKNTGLNSIEDIKSQKYPLRISVNKTGSTMELTSKAVMEAYGMTYKDIENWGGKVYFLSTKESMDLIDDKQSQAHSLTGEHPMSHFVESATRNDFKLLPISPEAVNKVNSKLGTHGAKIPAGTYSFNKEDVPTFAASLLLITGAGQSEEFVYNVTKALHQNLDHLRTVHATLKDMNPKTMADTAPIPLHPGAEKYYREIGVLK